MLQILFCEKIMGRSCFVLCRNIFWWRGRIFFLNFLRPLSNLGSPHLCSRWKGNGIYPKSNKQSGGLLDWRQTGLSQMWFLALEWWGEVINYTKWNSREPNNLGDREDCIEVRTNSAGWTPNRHWLNGTWNDRPCNDTSNHNGFVCKTK